MPRDLVTISTLIRECETDLANATTAVDNAMATLDAASNKQTATLKRFEALVQEHAEAVELSKAKGLRIADQVTEGPPPISDAAITEAFDRATTPQEHDQTRVFNGQAF